MKEIKDERIEAFEDAAMEGVKQLRAYFTYQGSDPKFFQKARIAAGVISAYARIRASETNRMAVEFASAKVIPIEPERKRLKAS